MMMKMLSPIAVLLALDLAAAVPSAAQEVSVEQSLALSADFLASLGGKFEGLEAAVSKSVDASVGRVSMGLTATSKRRMQGTGAVTINYYVACDGDVSCDSVLTQLGSAATQNTHATALISAVTAVAEAAGFVGGVISTAADVVASVAMPDFVAITMRDQLPGVLASPSGASPSKSRWRITNNSPIGDHWIISELQFFSNAECSVPVPNPTAVAWSASPFDIACGADSTTCPLLNDGVCDVTPNNCCTNTGTQWAGPDTLEGRAAGGTWISMDFAEPVAVNCVQLCHAAWANQQVTDVNIQFNDGAGWIDFETYYFDVAVMDDGVQVGGQGLSQGTHSYNIGSACDTAGMCPDGMFCNFDAGSRRSHCEACSDCSVCDTCGLTAQGESDCSTSCDAAPTPPVSTQWRVTNNHVMIDRWVISELTMSDSSGATITPVSVARSASPDGERNCEDASTCSMLIDGVCNSLPAGQPDGYNTFPRFNQWAGGNDADSIAVGGTWVAFTFATELTPAGLNLCHSRVEHQQALSVVLQYYDGSSWVDYDVIIFSRYAEDRTTIVDGTDYYTASTDCSGGAGCGVGEFCNFEVDGFNSGRCEACDANCAAGCDTCRLPGAAISDCGFMCATASGDSCPWTTDTGAANTFGCYDGTTCVGEGCCTSGVVKCPPSKALCDKPFQCGGGTQNCCSTDCASINAAPMACPGTIPESRTIMGRFDAGTTYINFLAQTTPYWTTGR